MSNIIHSFDLVVDRDNDSKNISFHKNTSCDSNEVFHEYKMSFTDAKTNLTADQRLSLLDFFFAKPLSEKEFRDALLKRAGWIKKDDTPDTASLYKTLLSVAGIENSIFFAPSISYSDFEKFGFYMFDTDKIKKGESSCCVNHPRAILRRDFPPLSAKLDGNMKVSISFKDNKEVEPKIQCLFRHLRNAIAHDNTYFINDKVLFIDYDKSGKISGAVLFKQQTLFDWIKLVNNGKTHTGYVLKCTNDESLYLCKIETHPLLINSPFNLMLKANEIRIEKKHINGKTSSWSDTTDISITVQESIKGVTGVVVDKENSSNILIAKISTAADAKGEYRITVPMKFSSINEKNQKAEQLCLYLSL